MAGTRPAMTERQRSASAMIGVGGDAPATNSRSRAPAPGTRLEGADVFVSIAELQLPGPRPCFLLPPQGTPFVGNGLHRRQHEWMSGAYAAADIGKGLEQHVLPEGL